LKEYLNPIGHHYNSVCAGVYAFDIDLASIANNRATTATIKSSSATIDVATISPRPGKAMDVVPLNQMTRKPTAKSELRMAANVRSTDIRLIALSSR
jgi:hypothetical protein